MGKKYFHEARLSDLEEIWRPLLRNVALHRSWMRNRKIDGSVD